MIDALSETLFGVPLNMVLDGIL